MSDHLADFRELATRLAPELCDVPFYLLRQPPSWPAPWDAFAYAVRGRHIPLREHLKATGQWQGQFGPTIVFIDEFATRDEFLASAIHELGHVLPPVVLDDVPVTADEVAEQQVFLNRFAAADSRKEMIREPWQGHGLKFIRREIHLGHRLALQGLTVTAAFAGGMYGLGPCWRYIEALGNEPQQMLNCSFSEIEAVPPPAAFTELFADDVARYRKNREVSKK